MRTRCLLVLIVFAASLFLDSRSPALASLAARQHIDVQLDVSDISVFERGRDDTCSLTIDGMAHPQFYIETAGRVISKQMLTTGTVIINSQGHTACTFAFSLAVSDADMYTLTALDVYRESFSRAELHDAKWAVTISIAGTNGVVKTAHSTFPLASSPQPTATATRIPSRSPVVTARTKRTDWECDQLQAYQAEMFRLLMRVDGFNDVQKVINSDDFTNIRPSTARSASEGIDEWVTMLEEMDDVPLAAKEYHAALIASFGTLSGMMLSYANGGMFALLPYSDTMDELGSDLDHAAALGIDRCGTAWTDVFGE